MTPVQSEGSEPATHTQNPDILEELTSGRVQALGFIMSNRFRRGCCSHCVYFNKINVVLIAPLNIAPTLDAVAAVVYSNKQKDASATSKTHKKQANKPKKRQKNAKCQSTGD